MQPQPIQTPKVSVDLLPCPHCGSTDLTRNEWWLDSEGEVDAVECSKCFAGAPVKSWNQRNA